MDGWLPLVIFLAVAVLIAALMLAPRFREAVGVHRPDVPSPSQLVALRLALDASPLADHPVATALREAMDGSPAVLVAAREDWRQRLRAAHGGPVEAVEHALDALADETVADSL